MKKIDRLCRVRRPFSKIVSLLVGSLLMLFLLSNQHVSNVLASLRRPVADSVSQVTDIQAEPVISPYDSLFRQYADSLAWDWRLLAALAAQESNFNPKVTSPDGARGLMQVRPATARSFGQFDLYHPEENIQAGVACLRYLDDLWKASVPDAQQRLYFVLASYNTGPAHIQDAQRLAKKYGKSTSKWTGHVGEYLKLKSQATYYQDPVVRHGKCRGEFTYQYVRKVLARFEQYQQPVPIADQPQISAIAARP